MKFSIQKLPKSELEIKVEISAKNFDNYLERTTFLLAENLEIEGFRKGKAPKEIIERTIGLEKILNETAQMAIKESYPKIILENQIEPLGQPEIEILKLAPGNPFEFKVKISVLPQLKLPDYKLLVSRMKKKEVFLSPEEIELFRREKEQIEREKLRQEILEKIAKESEMEIPEILIEEEKKRMLEEIKRQAPFVFQINFEDYLKKIGKNEKELFDSFLPDAEKRVKNLLILREIGKREIVEISKEEIEEELNKILRNYPETEKFDRERLKEYTEGVIKNEKTFQRLESFLS